VHWLFEAVVQVRPPEQPVIGEQFGQLSAVPCTRYLQKAKQIEKKKNNEGKTIKNKTVKGSAGAWAGGTVFTFGHAG